MDNETRTKFSKFMSLVLRHKPDAIGIALDRNGWVDINQLIERARANGQPLSREIVETIVVTSPKQRFAISEDGQRVRANQGHSVDVNLGYTPLEPPELLFHGTTFSHLPSIRLQGLRKMDRHQVHLSADPATAEQVGARHGRPVVLTIAAGRMHREGHIFFVSANGVWLTDRVPPEYIQFP